MQMYTQDKGFGKCGETKGTGFIYDNEEQVLQSKHKQS